MESTEILENPKIPEINENVESENAEIENKEDDKKKIDNIRCDFFPKKRKPENYQKQLERQRRQYEKNTCEKKIAHYFFYLKFYMDKYPEDTEQIRLKIIEKLLEK